MTCLKKAINLQYIYLTLKPKLIKNKNISILAPLSAARIYTFQFI